MTKYFETPEQALQTALKNTPDTVSHFKCSESRYSNTGEIYEGVDIYGNHTFNVKSTYPTFQNALSMSKKYVVYYPVK